MDILSCFFLPSNCLCNSFLSILESFGSGQRSSSCCHRVSHEQKTATALAIRASGKDGHERLATCSARLSYRQRTLVPPDAARCLSSSTCRVQEPPRPVPDWIPCTPVSRCLRCEWSSLQFQRESFVAMSTTIQPDPRHALSEHSCNCALCV